MAGTRTARRPTMAGSAARWCGGFLLIAAGAGPASALDDTTLAGTWLVEDRDATVMIYPCGAKFCGRITWLRESLFAADDEPALRGKPKTDRNNPDATRQSTPILGMQVLWGLKPDGAAWSGGHLYDPESGRTYRCSARLVSAGRLQLRGYVGISLFGRSTIWTRSSTSTNCPVAGSIFSLENSTREH